MMPPPKGGGGAHSALGPTKKAPEPTTARPPPLPSPTSGPASSSSSSSSSSSLSSWCRAARRNGTMLPGESGADEKGRRPCRNHRPHLLLLLLLRAARLQLLLALCACLHLALAWHSSSGSPSSRQQGNDRSNAAAAHHHVRASAPSSSLSSLDDIDDIHEIVERLPPQAFLLWNNRTLPLPCPRADRGKSDNWAPKGLQRSTGTQTGILFVKVPKAGSSTGSSVTLRIASRVFEKKKDRGSASASLPRNGSAAAAVRAPISGPPNVCKNRVHHSTTHRMGYERRDRTRSVLWTLVRDPTKRLVSEYFFFHVSRRRGTNASDPAQFHTYVNSWKNRRRLPSFQVRYLSFRNLDRNRTDQEEEEAELALAAPAEPPTPDVSVDAIRSIFRDYDFVGVSERMDESLVALQLLLGLETEDIVHLNSKVSGGYDDGQSEMRCAYIQPSVRTPEMDAFFDGPVWRQWSHWDAVLHRAANRSLDLTIARLGQDRFHERLDAYRDLQRSVNAACTRPDLVPCDASRAGLPPRPARVTGCVWGDVGCGFACIDLALASRRAGRAA